MYTALYKKTKQGYVAWLEEVPGVLTQGKTLSETRENLEDALGEFLIVRRQETRRTSKTASLRREQFAFA